MKKIAQFILKILAIKYLRKYNPDIIAITGSVGKTSTRKAVTLLLEKKFKTRRFEENSYNTEIGLPLFILGQRIPNYKILWPIVFLKSLYAALFTEETDVLVLEMGADKPGDIAYFLDFIKPNVSIITRITSAHIEAFGDLDNVLDEKGLTVRRLGSKNLAILNNDDNLIMTLEKETKAKIVTIGLSEDSDIRAYRIKQSISGISCKISINNKEYDYTADFVGEHLLYPVMAAIAVGLYYEYSEKEIMEILSQFTSIKGRMNILPGINKSVILDDSYNANPVSTIKALETLRDIAPGRKVAVLGTMNELGEYFRPAHHEVADAAVQVADILVLVGEGGKIIAKQAKLLGFNKANIHQTDNSDDAGEVLKGIIGPNDTILFKGSQNKVRLEKAVKRVLANPDDAEDVLVRQSKFWQNR